MSATTALRAEGDHGESSAWIFVGLLVALPMGSCADEGLYAWAGRNRDQVPSIVGPGVLAAIAGILFGVYLTRRVMEREVERQGRALALCAGVQSTAGVAVSVFVLTSALLGISGSSENPLGHASACVVLWTASLVLVQIAALFARARSRSYRDFQLLAFLAWFAGPVAISSLAGRWLF